MTASTAAVAGAFAGCLGVAAGSRLWRRYLRAGDEVRRFAEATHTRLGGLGAVDRLEILPLVERLSAHGDLRTEVGVSYLLTVTTAGSTTRVLFDLGLNRRHTDRPALVVNADHLGVDLRDLAAVVVSHAHDDHVGGPVALRRRRPALAGDAPVGPSGVPLHVPVPLGHDRMTAVLTTAPTVLAPGMAVLPPAPATMFWDGTVHEQALAVHVRGRGLVLVSGCGHPGTGVLLDLAARTLTVPVHAVVGGLHLPVRGYPAIALLGSPRPPWDLLDDADIDAALGSLWSAGVLRVALSGHDSTPWTMRRFAEELPGAGIEFSSVRVGERIVVDARRTP